MNKIYVSDVKPLLEKEGAYVYFPKSGARLSSIDKEVNCRRDYCHLYFCCNRKFITFRSRNTGGATMSCYYVFDRMKTPLFLIDLDRSDIQEGYMPGLKLYEAEHYFDFNDVSRLEFGRSESTCYDKYNFLEIEVPAVVAFNNNDNYRYIRINNSVDYVPCNNLNCQVINFCKGILLIDGDYLLCPYNMKDGKINCYTTTRNIGKALPLTSSIKKIKERIV